MTSFRAKLREARLRALCCGERCLHPRGTDPLVSDGRCLAPAYANNLDREDVAIAACGAQIVPVEPTDAQKRAILWALGYDPDRRLSDVLDVLPFQSAEAAVQGYRDALAAIREARGARIDAAEAKDAAPVRAINSAPANA